MYKIVFITNDVCAFVNEGAMNQTHWRWTHSVKVSVEPPLDKVKPNVTLGAGGSVKCFPIQISVPTLRSPGTCKSGVCVWWPAWMPVCAGMKRWTLQIKLAGKTSHINELWVLLRDPASKSSGKAMKHDSQNPNSGLHKHSYTCAPKDM